MSLLRSLLLLFPLLLTLSFPTPLAENDGLLPSSMTGTVGTISQKNFDAAVAKEPSVLVYVGAPWCGHCQRLKPAFEEAAKLLVGHTACGYVDGQKERVLQTRLGVKGYPSIFLFKEGTMRAYKGARSAQALAAFARTDYVVRPFASASLSDELTPASSCCLLCLEHAAAAELQGCKQPHGPRARQTPVRPRSRDRRVPRNSEELRAGRRVYGGPLCARLHPLGGAAGCDARLRSRAGEAAAGAAGARGVVAGEEGRDDTTR